MTPPHETPAETRSSAWRRALHHRRLIALALLTMTLVLLALLFPRLMYRHIDEVDIRSGRIRRSDYAFCIRLNRSTEASALSDAVPGCAQGATADWHFVNTLEGARRVSPHYNFHGAIAQIAELDRLWQLIPFTPEAKQQVAMTVLTKWQAGGSYWDANEYIRAVEGIGLAAEEARHPVRLSQLPGYVPSTRPTTKP